MNLIFYDCTADHRRVNKIPFMTEKWQHNVDRIDARDLLNPQFTINYEDDMPLEFNYAYCPEIKRYYFVTTQVHKAAKKVTFVCSVDVRMTWLSNTLYDIDFPMTVLRNQYAKNSNVPDNKLPVDPSYHEFEVLPFETDEFMLRGSASGDLNLRQAYEVIEIIGGASY